MDKKNTTVKTAEKKGNETKTAAPILPARRGVSPEVITDITPDRRKIDKF